MKTKDAIKWAGGTQHKLAAVLGCAQSVVGEWGEYPSSARQLQIQVLSMGLLQAEPWAVSLEPAPPRHAGGRRKRQAVITEPQESGAS